MRTPSEHRTGDVVSVTRVDGVVGDLFGILVVLHGHAHRYVVRVVTGKGGPRLVDLQIRSDSDAAITPEVLRAIPSRRLAHAAAQFATMMDGKMATPSMARDPEANSRPGDRTARGKLTDAHYEEVAERVRAAVLGGFPVRQTVAAQMHTSIQTLDRWIRKSKDLGFLEEDELPRRKNPEPSPSADREEFSPSADREGPSESADRESAEAQPARRRRRKADDYAMLERLANALSGHVSVVPDVDPEKVTPEEAAQLLGGGDLAESIRTLTHLQTLLTEKAEQ